MQIEVNGSKPIDINDAVFAAEFNEGLIHQVITSYMASGRQGTKAQKNRSDVRGGGAKPWKQKGTGRARAGTSRSPIWRSGGVTFAARPRSFEKKVNKKMYRKALSSILSELFRQERLTVVEQFKVEAIKTRNVVAALESIKMTKGSVMIVTLEQDNDLLLASRNLPHVDAYSLGQLDPVSLVGFDHIVFTAEALKKLEENLS